ncbi:MAG: hypothetical protein ACI8UO_000345 [Verrucomicrobiales bacterium]|jgi:hypothetical protein
MRLLFKASIALAALWGAVIGIMWLAGSYEVTPEKIEAYVEENPIAKMDDSDEREGHIRKVAKMVNQLDYEARGNMRRPPEPGRDPFWRHLTPEERVLMIELTMGNYFDNMMRAFNEMDPDERALVAQQTIKRLRENERMRPDEAEQLEGKDGAEMFEKVMSEGLRAYYQGASADTKIDFAPVLEELQTVLQDPRSRWKRQQQMNYGRESEEPASRSSN